MLLILLVSVHPLIRRKRRYAFSLKTRPAAAKGAVSPLKTGRRPSAKRARERQGGPGLAGSLFTRFKGLPAFVKKGLYF
jgi:hypothetical protein